MLTVKAVVAAFNQEKALVGAFYVIIQLRRLIVYSTTVNHAAGLLRVTQATARKQEQLWSARARLQSAPSKHNIKPAISKLKSMRS